MAYIADASFDEAMREPASTITKKPPATNAIVPPADRPHTTASPSPTTAIMVDASVDSATKRGVDATRPFKTVGAAAIKEIDTTVPTAGIMTVTVAIIRPRVIRRIRSGDRKSVV